MAEVESKWYVIRVVNGTESKVKRSVESEVGLTFLKDYVRQVLVPTESVLQSTKSGKKKKDVVYLPGYVFIEVVKMNEVFGALLDIPGVLGFVGCKHKSDTPVALRPEEAARLLGKVNDELSKDSALLQPFTVGEEIKVIDGPFSTFNGVIEEIDAEKMKLKITVKIFGRKTPLELDFAQVEKV